MTSEGPTSELRRDTLDAEERQLVERIEARRDDLVDLTCQLICYDTTTRAEPDEPARQEAALQTFLAKRLYAAGAEIDLWEPEPGDIADHPLTAGRTFRFDGRPQLAARLRGRGGGRSLLFDGHIDVVPASMEEWGHDPFDPRVRDGVIIGRGASDMKGGVASMVVAAEAVAERGALRGDIILCTNTEEEASGTGALACARRGVAADFAIVPEATDLEVWPACRGGVYCSIIVPGRAGHVELEHPHWRDGGAVNAIDMARHLLVGVDRLRTEWHSRASFRHPLLDPPNVRASRLVADSGWSVTIPDRAEITLAVNLLPGQADANGWTTDVQQEVEAYLRRWCDGDSWLSEHPPTFRWHTENNPSETPADAPSVQALLGANAALGLPQRLGGLASWYDGATFALEAKTPAVMYGPRPVSGAHTVGEHVPIEDLVRCAQGLAIACLRLCR